MLSEIGVELEGITQLDRQKVPVLLMRVDLSSLVILLALPQTYFALSGLRGFFREGSRGYALAALALRPWLPSAAPSALTRASPRESVTKMMARASQK